jgi:hypothetical protein
LRQTIAATAQTQTTAQLRLLLVGGLSSRPKFTLIDYLCNVFIKRREGAIYCPIIAELIDDLT